MASALVGKGWTGTWLRVRNGRTAAVALGPNGQSVGRAIPAFRPSIPGETGEVPRLVAGPPPFGRPPEGRLLPIGAIAGDSNAVAVTPQSYHVFVYMPVDPAAGAAPAASCEIDFFPATDSAGQDKPRCAHYTLALPSASHDGHYHAFRIIAPKAAAAAVVRFLDGDAEALAGTEMFLVPTASLTYAASDLAINRHFCPIPVGRLFCRFETQGGYLTQIAAKLASARTAPRSPSPSEEEAAPGKAVFHRQGATAPGPKGANPAPPEPVSVPFTDGLARYAFRPPGPRAVVAVEFADTAPGASLERPLAAVAVGPDFPPEYLALDDEFFDSRYKTAREAFARLNFPEAAPTATECIPSPRIIAVAGEFLRIHMSAFSGFTPVSETDATAAINSGDPGEAPGILVVESLFCRAGQSWLSAGTTAVTEDPRLQELLRLAGRRGWVRVLWFSEESVHFEAFAPRLDLFDRVVSEVEIARDRCPGFPGEITTRPPFADVRLANPLLTVPKGGTYHRFVTLARRPLEQKVLVVGWADLLEGAGIEEIFDNSSLCDLHVGEEQWKFKANKVADIPRLMPNIIGYMSHLELIEAFKRYGAALFFYPSLRSEAQLVRLAMTAALCNCLPIVYCTGEASVAHPLLQEIAVIVEDPEQLRGLIGRVAEEDLVLARRRHLIWRFAAMQNASARAVAAALGIADSRLPPRIEDVSVSIVTPTKRPEFLAQTYAQICRQQHSSWEWIVVLNRRDVPLKELPEEIRADDRVRIVTVGQSKNIGFCMELGISLARGALWAKWDDDDLYGPGYLSDTVLLSRMTNAELIGRPPSYFYFESDHGLFRRPASRLAFVVYSGGQPGLVSGATLAGRVDRVRTVSFGLDWRSCVDTDYMEAIAQSGATTCSGPHFGVVSVRAADPTRHTWRAPESELLAVHKEQIGGDPELELVLP